MKMIWDAGGPATKKSRDEWKWLEKRVVLQSNDPRQSGLETEKFRDEGGPATAKPWDECGPSVKMARDEGGPATEKPWDKVVPQRNWPKTRMAPKQSGTTTKVTQRQGVSWRRHGPAAMSHTKQSASRLFFNDKKNEKFLKISPFHTF